MSNLDRKFIITAELRDLEEQRHLGDISYSRMIELLNEKASNYAKQQVIKGKIEVYEDVIYKYSLSAENWDDIIDKIRILESELKQLEKL